MHYRLWRLDNPYHRRQPHRSSNDWPLNFLKYRRSHPCQGNWVAPVSLQACSSHILNNDGSRISVRPGYAIQRINAHLLWLCTTFANNNVLSMTTTIWFCWVDENRQAKDSSAKYPSRLEMSSLFSLLLCWCTQSTPSLLSDCNFLGTVLLAGWTSLQEPCHSFFFYSQLCNWPHSFLSICYSDPYIWQLFLFKACPFQVILS